MRKITVTRAMNHYLKVVVNFSITRMESFYSHISMKTSGRAFSIKRANASGNIGLRSGAKALLYKIVHPHRNKLALYTSARSQTIRLARGRKTSVAVRSEAAALLRRLGKLSQKTALHAFPAGAACYTPSVLADCDHDPMGQIDDKTLFELSYKAKQ